MATDRKAKVEVQKVCRACLQLIENPEYSLENENLIQDFIPDRQARFPDSFFCDKCTTFLGVYRNFKQMCLVTEDKINSYVGAHSSRENITLLDVVSGLDGEVEDPDQTFDDGFMKKVEVVLKIDSENEEDVEQEFRCENCNLSFSTMYFLLQHTASCDVKNDDKTFECQHCDFATDYAANLRRHTKAKHKTDTKLHGCEFCDYKTPLRFNLKTHVNSVHTKETNYACELCDFSTFSKSGLSVHMKSHKTGKSLVCEHCDQTFSRKQTHEEHLLKKHGVQLRNDKEPIKCSQCHYVTYSSAILKRHCNSAHKTSTN